jgi:hypothetical protein
MTRSARTIFKPILLYLFELSRHSGLVAIHTWNGQMGSRQKKSRIPVHG